MAAAAQVLGMGHVRAISTSSALSSPPLAPLAARDHYGHNVTIPNRRTEAYNHTYLSGGA